MVEFRSTFLEAAMKQLSIILVGALAVAVAVAGAAQAAQPQPATDTVSVQQDAKKPDANDHRCLRQTGTRISSRTDTRKQRACSNGAIGRAYTREDMDRTGEVNIADALRKLDPSIH
jgi:hypothetical protein